MLLLLKLRRLVKLRNWILMRKKPKIIYFIFFATSLPATPVWQNSELTPTDSSISSAATATESSTTGSKGQTSGATGVSVGWLFVAGLTSLLF